MAAELEYRIVRKPGIAALEVAAADLLRDGWSAVGGPVFDHQMAEWCQAVTRAVSPVNLKEPARRHEAPPSPKR